MAPPAGHTTPAWECRACYGADGKRYRNSGSRKICSKCGCAKGSCFHDNVKPSTPSRRTGGVNAKPNPADEAKRVKELEATLKKQTAELEKLKSAAAGTPDNVSVDGGADDQHIVYDKRIKYLRDSVALLKNAPSEEAKPGALVETEEKLAALLRAKEEAKPPNARLSSAKSKLVQREKALEKANAAKSAAEKILADAQEELAKAAEAQTTAVEAVSAAKADLAAANELVTGKAAAAPSEIKSVDELQTLFNQVGETVVAVAHPDKRLALGQLLAQIQTSINESKARDVRPAAAAVGNPQLPQPTAEQAQLQLDSVAAENEAGGNQLADASLDASMCGLDFSGVEECLDSDEEGDDEDGAKKLKAKFSKLKDQVASLKKAANTKSALGLKTSALKLKPSPAVPAKA